MAGAPHRDALHEDDGRADFAKYSQGEIEVPGLKGDHKVDMDLIRDKIADKYNLAPGKSTTARRQAALDWLRPQPDGYGGGGLAPHHAGGDTIQFIPRAVHKVQHTDMFDYGTAAPAPAVTGTPVKG